MKRLMMLAVAVAAAMPLMAATKTVGEYTWTYQINGDTAEIRNGYSAAISPSPTGAVTIPSTLGGKPVKIIGQYAFYRCSGLTSVTIPNSVTNIGSYAFCGCRSLMSVMIPDGVTSIGVGAFSDCSGLASVTIPDGVMSIGSSAFSGCSALASVTIPDSMTRIGASVFYNCSSLASVTIPDSVTSIGSYAFYGCRELANKDGFIVIRGAIYGYVGDAVDVSVPDGVTSIGEGAFSNCTSLVSVILPNSITNIGDCIFYGCTNVQSITLPFIMEGKDSLVTSMGVGYRVLTPFAGLQRLFVKATSRNKYYYENSNPINYTAWEFEGCVPTSLVRVVVTEEKCVRNFAFQHCSMLHSVVLPECVTNIGKSAFSGCTRLTDFQIPDGIQHIGDNAFEYCHAFTNVTIPSHVSFIGAYAFRGCSSLTNVTMSDSVSIIGNHAFDSCRCLVNVTLPDSVKRIGAGAFSYCTNLVSMTIPDGVMSIGDSAFSGCNGLDSVHITDLAAWCGISFAAIDANPLCYANKLYLDGVQVTDLMVPEGVRNIGNYSFSSNSSLTSVTIPNSVTSVGDLAFSGCTKLTHVAIPNSVMNIGVQAFSGCTNITSLTASFVPAGMDRRKLTNVTIPDGVVSIVDGAFSDCYGLTDIVIPDSVTSIGDGAFRYCGGLKSMSIPNSVTNIGDSAFSGCSGLEEIELPFVGAVRGNTEVVDSLLGHIFGMSSYSGSTATRQYYSSSSFCTYYIPSKLKKVVITDETVLGYGAFYNCSNLVNVTIPNSVTNIGSSAFSGCSGLAKITLPFVGSRRGNSGTADSCFGYIFGTSSYTGGTATQQYYTYYIPSQLTKAVILDETVLGCGAFYNCSNLVNVTIPNSVTNIGSSAFSGCSGLEEITLPFVGSRRGNWGTADSCFGYIFGTSSYTGGTATQQYYTYYIPSQLTKVVILDETVLGCGAFERCNGLTSVTIPDSVISIRDEAFFGCSGLTGVTIPDSVTSIGRSTFSGCSGLTNVTIPHGVTYIGDSAFSGCSGLVNLTIPDSVTGIGASVFSGCSGLTSVTIPDGMMYIGNSTFSGCSGLSRVVIPNSVTDIGKRAFYGCSGLVSVVLGDGVEYIGEEAFSGCSGLARVMISDNVTYMGPSVFSGCRGLVSVTIGKGVEYIGNEAFSDCSNLTSVTIGNGVIRIGDYAFSGCSGLRALTIPDGVLSIGECCVSECDNMVRLSVPDSLETFGYYDLPKKIKDSLACDSEGFLIHDGWVLGNVNASASALTIPANVRCIGTGAFAGFQDLQTVKIHRNIRTIGYDAFRDCTYLDNVEIPDSVTMIGESAFENCSYMQTIAIGSGVRKIRDRAFARCASLQAVVLPSGVETIGNEAFYNDWRMLSVSIPHSVTNIGENAFGKCKKLTGVTVPTTVGIMTNLFPDAYSTIDTVAVAEGETSIMNRMFAWCSNMVNFAWAGTETNVGVDAFEDCVSLQEVVVPHSVKSMGSSVFYNCSSLREVSLSRNLTAIPSSAFWKCSSLDSLIVPASVTSIGSKFFDSSTVAIYYLGTTAPSSSSSAYSGAADSCVSYVVRDSRGWDGPGSRVLPELWNGHAITYWTPNQFDVTFDANGGRFDDSGGTTWSEQQITDMGYSLPSTEPVRPGWVFEGWWTEPVNGAQIKISTRVTLTRAHTIYAHWRYLGDRMTVRFNANGGTAVVPETQEYVPGQTFGEFPVPTRRGYEFTGWHTTANMGIVSANTVVETNATLYAQWEPDLLGPSTMQIARPMPYEGTNEIWSVWLDARGAWLEDEYRMLSFEKGSRFGALPVLEWNGWIFLGWSFHLADYGRITEATQVPASDMELFARWMPIYYYVRFNANGGAGTMTNQVFVYDAPQNLKTHTFTRTGFAFSGWATTPGGQVRYAENAGVVNLEEVKGRIVDLYAVWSGAGYSVRFDSNGGSGFMDNQTIALGETQNLWPNAYTRSGYAFAGWATSPMDAASGKVAYRDGATVQNLATSNSVTVPLYAVWMAESQTARIAFDANGGSVSPDYWDCVIGSAVEAFPLPTRPGFTFDGWFTLKNGGERVLAIESVARDMTFYAHWSENGTVIPGPNECLVIFNANGGSVSPLSRTVTSGMTVGELPIPIRTDYTFGGWFSAASGGTQVTSLTVVAGDVTYYAHWVAVVNPDPVVPDPVTPDPVTPDPVIPDPVTPDPVTPDPVTPDPVTPDPVTPDPVTPEPVTPDPVTPDPVTPDPVKPGPVTPDPVKPEPVKPEPVTPDIEPTPAPVPVQVVKYGGVVENVAFTKAQTKMGALYDAKGTLVGTVELKFGKKGKKGVKVSASATMIIGGKSKKISAKAVTLGDGETRKTLTFKDPIGEMMFVMGADGVFTLKGSGYEMVGAIESGATGRRALPVGGVLPDKTMHFSVVMDSMPDFGKDGALLDEALPVNEPVHVQGGRWSFDKVPTPKYKKNRETGAYELLGLDDSAKPNVSGLKLSYTAKTGVFKGSFKLYATNEATTPEGKSPKLKKFTVNVIGFVVDGEGIGQASLKKPAASWVVTVK